MRILARANAHRLVLSDGNVVGLEVASSPDTPTRPDRWSWSIRLLDSAPLEPSALPSLAKPSGVAALCTNLDRSGNGGSGFLEVLVEQSVVTPEVELVAVTGADELERDARDLVALVVVSGVADIEHRHVLCRYDALVLEGEDPLRISIDAVGGPVDVAVVRLKSTRDVTVNWVP